MATVQWAASLRNMLLDTFESDIGVSPVVKFFTGALPANAAAADSGTLLVTYTLAADWMANAAAGVKTFNGLPIAGVSVATGSLGYYRIYQSGGAVCKEQGDITATGGGGAMTVDVVAIGAIGQSVNITGYTKTAPHP